MLDEWGTKLVKTVLLITLIIGVVLPLISIGTASAAKAYGYFDPNKLDVDTDTPYTNIPAVWGKANDVLIAMNAIDLFMYSASAIVMAMYLTGRNYKCLDTFLKIMFGLVNLINFALWLYVQVVFIMNYKAGMLKTMLAAWWITIVTPYLCVVTVILLVVTYCLNCWGKKADPMQHQSIAQS